MVDTPVVEPPVVEPPVVPPVVAPAVHFNNDGTFGDGWQGTLEETLREDKSLATFKNVNDLAKSFVNTKSMVGKNTMEIPTDASSEATWDAFYKIGGKPETVADYNLKAPDDFPAEVLEQVFPKAKLEVWQERFFKTGISKKAADQFIADFAQDILADLKTVKQAEEMALSELTTGLSVDWGAAYDQKIHLGNMAIEEGTTGDAEFKARVVAKIQHDPDLTRFTANLGSKFAEGKPPNFGSIPTPSDYQTQIDEIRANPLYLNGTQAERMKLANQELELRKKMNPEKAT